ncbi:MAG: hypothetical protein AB7S26_14775 [Sandaracinaceae bacterium]
MTPLLRRWSLRLALLAIAALPAGLAIDGCAAPGVPVPPPTALIESPPDMDGNVTITGMARDSAYVSCFNDATEMGVIVRAAPVTGEFTAVLPAMTGDNIVIWQYDGTDAPSMQLELTVP